MSDPGSRHRDRDDRFGLGEIAWRWGAAFVLVVVTWNPSGWSYVHWARTALLDSEMGPMHVLFGLLLVAGWVVFIAATRRSLGSLGVVIGVAVMAALVWLFADLGWLTLDSAKAVGWVVVIGLSVLLALGMSWSHLWRRMSGQVEVDDVD